MLKLYGDYLSYISNATIMSLNLLNIDYEFHRINLKKGEQRNEDFLKINPIGKVPVLLDDDFIITENNTIIRYLLNKYETSYYVKDIKSRAKVDESLDFISSNITPNISILLFNYYFTGMLNIEKDFKEIEKAKKNLHRFLKFVNKKLEQNKFFLGDEITVIDSVLIAILDPIDVVSFDIKKYKNLTNYRNNLMKKEFYLKCHNKYEDSLNK